MEYFCEELADAFLNVQGKAERGEIRADMEGLLGELRPMQRQLLTLFADLRVVVFAEIADYLGSLPRQAGSNASNGPKMSFWRLRMFRRSPQLQGGCKV